MNQPVNAGPHTPHTLLPLPRARPSLRWWALSVDDWLTHVIDERADHPSGVYRAECGHILSKAVTLHQELYGKPCPGCAALQIEVAQDALARAADGLRQAQQ